MEAFLTDLVSNSSFPIFTAFFLGLLTAISPCPMATNITAIGFISKDVKEQKKVFWNGVVYTFGRAISYTLIALIIYFGADQFELSGWFAIYGEKILGPLLIVMGIFMLDLIKFNLPAIGNLGKRLEEKKSKSYLDALLLGIIFALAFCPYSGVLYFGMLIPMTVASASGLYLPIVFAFATGIPVIIFAWLIAYAISGVGQIFNRIIIFEKWFRRFISVVFIAVGVYYVVVIYF